MCSLYCFKGLLYWSFQMTPFVMSQGFTHSAVACCKSSNGDVIKAWGACFLAGCQPLPWGFYLYHPAFKPSPEADVQCWLLSLLPPSPGHSSLSQRPAQFFLAPWKANQQAGSFQVRSSLISLCLVAKVCCTFISRVLTSTYSGQPKETPIACGLKVCALQLSPVPSQ